MPNFSELDGNFEGLISDVQDPSQSTEDPIIEDPNTTTDTVPNLEEPVETNMSYIESFLADYGLKNGMVVYESEDGGTEERKFTDLDEEEKLSILKELTASPLTEEETNTINYLRERHTSLNTLLEQVRQQAVKEYVESHEGAKAHSIDSYSDDEVYLASQKSKYPDMTDEELLADLETAKTNEELFNKKVNILRTQYKQIEEEELKAEQEKQEHQAESFRQSIKAGLEQLSDVPMDYRDVTLGSWEVDDEQRNLVYRYLIEPDANGVTQFVKDIQDPQKLAQLGWLACYGIQAIADTTEY